MKLQMHNAISTCIVSTCIGVGSSMTHPERSQNGVLMLCITSQELEYHLYYTTNSVKRILLLPCLISQRTAV